MIWTGFKESNHLLGSGGNPETGDLPIAISVNRDIPGVAFCVSCWKMTDEEKEHFLKTGEIWLAVMAPLKRPTQAPVSLMVFNPFEVHNYHAYTFDELHDPKITDDGISNE